MPIKMECKPKIGISLKLECHSVTQNGMSQNAMSLKIECHSKCNFTLTQNRILLKMECNSK